MRRTSFPNLLYARVRARLNAECDRRHLGHWQPAQDVGHPAVQLQRPLRGRGDRALREHPEGAVGRGAITPGEGYTLSQMIETFLRAIDASDFESRLRQLEEDQAARREDKEARRYNWAGRFDSRRD